MSEKWKYALWNIWHHVPCPQTMLKNFLLCYWMNTKHCQRLLISSDHSSPSWWEVLVMIIEIVPFIWYFCFAIDFVHERGASKAISALHVCYNFCIYNSFAPCHRQPWIYRCVSGSFFFLHSVSLKTLSIFQTTRVRCKYSSYKVTLIQMFVFFAYNSYQVIFGIFYCILICSLYIP